MVPMFAPLGRERCGCLGREARQQAHGGKVPARGFCWPRLTNRCIWVCSMVVSTAIVAALITSSAGFVIASWSAAWTAYQNRRARDLQQDIAAAQSRSQVELEKLKHELQLSARHEEQFSEAKAELDRFREPLLLAANDLGDRIDNIRNKGFLHYLRAPDHRREMALRSTLYRFGRFFAQLEALYASLSLMRFQQAEDTKIVAGLLADIGRTFASDRLDREGSPTRPRLMLWREEQRAIGELMRDGRDSKEVTCVGYSSFVNNYRDYASWFSTFAEDLESGDATKSERLARLQSLLAQLVIQLDIERIYTSATQDGHPTSPGWVTRVAGALRME
jgi:hypothetical protein